MTLEEILTLTTQLPLIDKLRLIEQITPQITKELMTAQSKQRKSLRGLWQGVNTSDSTITEARQEMWGRFPSEDI